MNFRDRMSGLFWLLISILICVQSIRINIGTLNNPGPGFLPFWAGVVLGIFSIVLLVTSILKRNGEKSISSLWKGMEWNKVILVLSSLFIYAILLHKLGYLITTFGLLVFLFVVMRRQNIWIWVVSALTAALLSYFIFYVWLGVQLPKGILGF